MNNLKHTPGPWNLAQSGPAMRYRIESDGTPIALTFGQERQTGDAVLMMEAPAMLAAVREAAEFIRTLLDADEITAGDILCNCGEAVESQLRSILARLDNP